MIFGSDRFGPAPDETRLLIAEPDSDVGIGLEELFAMKGYPVTRVDTGEAAFDAITGLPPYDAALLAGRLPGRDGFAVLREARRHGVDTPVLLLSTLTAPRHRIRGFQLGADDYVTKPFDAEELAARVRAVLRRDRQNRQAACEDGGYSFGPYTVDPARESITRNGSPVDLTDTEFEILVHLLRRRGRVVRRADLLRTVWGIEGTTDTQRVRRHVASLRRTIEPDPENPTYLQTVHSVGYKLVE